MDQVDQLTRQNPAKASRVAHINVILGWDRTLLMALGALRLESALPNYNQLVKAQWALRYQGREDEPSGKKQPDKQQR